MLPEASRTRPHGRSAGSTRVLVARTAGVKSRDPRELPTFTSDSRHRNALRNIRAHQATDHLRCATPSGRSEERHAATAAQWAVTTWVVHRSGRARGGICRVHTQKAADRVLFAPSSGGQRARHAHHVPRAATPCAGHEWCRLPCQRATRNGGCRSAAATERHEDPALSAARAGSAQPTR